MNIYLVQVDYSKYFSQEIVPLGLLHIGSALYNKGYKVNIIHCTEQEIDKNVEEIVKNKPLWVGFSVMTGPQTMHSAWMSKKIKDKSDVPIVWGGIHPSILPDQCLEEDYIDAVIIGEGEETAIELTKVLEEKKDLEGILGLGHRNVNKKPCVHQKRPFIKNLDEDRYKLEFDLLDMSKYFLKAGKYKRVFSYKSSRGCPYNCSFCYNLEFNQRKWRAKSAERVIEEIKYLKNKYSIDGIKFYDDNFYVDKNRALKILENIGIPAKTDIRIDMLTEDLASKIKNYNVFDILIGIESGSNRILELINKGFTVECIKEGVKILAKYDLRVGYSAIVGIPTETNEEMNATIDLILWINSIHKNKTVTIGPFLPYPGSPLYDWSINQGFVPPKKTEDWGFIERWKKDLYKYLPWVKDEYIYRIREYMKFFNYSVPLLSNIAEFRLKNKFMSFPIDIYVINYLYDEAVQEKTWLGKLVRKIHKLIKV
ncbi:MAG: hypothetical protein A2252_07410 [Elusimicrobia bacterium RIFOXYA2_FULL_39_19]|nr:MAG: hypothetical protein A2252_07410 [Elusimicrobia bacterium RIFOXYA2_FULL_39_19]